MPSAPQFLTVLFVLFNGARGILLKEISHVTPVEKVVSLLEGLKAEVENDGLAEATAYSEFACFCQNTTSSKSTSITSGQDAIDLGSANIAEKTATQNEKSTELQKRQTTQGELAAELKATEARCAKEKADYDAKDADLTKAISSLESASKRMTDSKPPGSALLELRQSVERSLARVGAHGFVFRPDRQRSFGVLQSFLQQGVDPTDPEYKYHSQGIIDTIEGLLKDFRAEKASVDAEWVKTLSSCEETKESLSDEMTSNADAIKALGEDIEKLKVQISTARGDLINSESVLKDDQLYLKDLTAQCEQRAKDWDQRSQLRADELEALTKALTILTNNVVSADAAVNQRALLIEKRTRSSVSFLQQHAIQARQKRQQQAVALLRSEGLRLRSAVLGSLATRTAADPFAKVKELIQKLVERLLAESTAEATKKGFCDEEMGKATQDRDNRFADATKLSVEITSLEAKRDKLDADIGSLTSSVSSLRADLSNATQIRSDEKTANLATMKQAKEGLTAVSDAISILKDFYKQAAKAQDFHSGTKARASLTQKKASPVDEDTSGPGFTDAYQGKQEASTNIIGMLEVIRSDFERTIRTTEASEKEAAADHVEFDRASNVDIGGKETKAELNQEDLKTTRNTIEAKMNDLQTAMGLLDSALKELEELKPVCVDMTMSYEERVQKRDEEIAALKRALCILDTDNVEEECQGGR